MITVDILYHEDCTHYATAIRYIKEVLAEEGIEATINEINVATVETAQELNFSDHRRSGSTVKISNQKWSSSEGTPTGVAVFITTRGKSTSRLIRKSLGRRSKNISKSVTLAQTRFGRSSALTLLLSA